GRVGGELVERLGGDRRRPLRPLRHHGRGGLPGSGELPYRVVPIAAHNPHFRTRGRPGPALLRLHAGKADPPAPRSPDGTFVPSPSPPVGVGAQMITSRAGDNEGDQAGAWLEGGRGDLAIVPAHRGPGIRAAPG